jgi:hypothetical protein
VRVDDDRLTLSVQRYDERRGAVADVEGGTVRVSLDGDGVYNLGDAAGLRDLARWCLALTDPEAKRGSQFTWTRTWSRLQRTRSRC